MKILLLENDVVAIVHSSRATGAQPSDARDHAKLPACPGCLLTHAMAMQRRNIKLLMQ